MIIYSHNLFHRGNHRLDHPDEWENKPRYMWRFWLYRTHEPLPSDVPPVVAWGRCGNGADPLTGLDLSEADSNVTVVWRYHHHWLHTGSPPPAREEALALTSEARTTEAATLWKQLHVKHDAGEPLRIGAAYKLASIGDEELALTILEKALYEDRESVRRGKSKYPSNLCLLGSFLTACWGLQLPPTDSWQLGRLRRPCSSELRGLRSNG